jgi:hypothetical protein
MEPDCGKTGEILSKKRLNSKLRIEKDWDINTNPGLLL